MSWLMRRFFAFTRWASLVLVVGGTALWITSYWREALFFYHSGQSHTAGNWRVLHVFAIHGQFHVKYDENFVTQEPPLGHWRPGGWRLRFKRIEPQWEPPALSDLWRFLWGVRHDPYPNGQGF